MITGKVAIAWRERPFDGRFYHEEIPAGGTVAQIIDPLRHLPSGFIEGAGEIRLNGDMIPRDMWARVKPKSGTSLTIHSPLRDPGGGGKQTAALVATIAVLLVAAAVSGGAAAGVGLLGFSGIGTLAPQLLAAGWGASVAGAAIGVGGRLHIGGGVNV